jgi:hypothetical protein
MSRTVIQGKPRNISYSSSHTHLIPSIIAIITLASLLLLLQTSLLAASGHNRLILEEARAELVRENQLLEKEIAILNSLEYAEQKAKELNMNPSEQPLYVNVPSPQTLDMPDLTIHPPHTQSIYPENWWDAFFTWIGFQQRAVNP